MARRRGNAGAGGGSGGGAGKAGVESEAEDGGWPVEWTCIGLVVACVALVAGLGRLAPSIFAGQCTTLSGMCTPAQCSCPPPLRKHELVTADEQACFRCIEEFCPAVTEGEEACTTSPCECEDPSWPRVAVQRSGGVADADGALQQSCWQCVRPSLDFTLRAGSGNDTCLAFVADAPHSAGAAPALSDANASAAAAGLEANGSALSPPGGLLPAPRRPGRRLTTVRNRSACATVRYDGARIMERGRNGSCLAWHHFGAYWGFTDCDSKDPRMRFESLPFPSPSPSVSEVLPGTASGGSHTTSSAVYCSGVVQSAVVAPAGPPSDAGPAGAGPPPATSPPAEGGFCIEVAERLCTEEEGRCSTERCRCANLSWTRQELQTLQDAQVCFNCVPPATHCATAAGACTPGPCECADPSHTKLQGTSHGMMGHECFRCEPQWVGSALRAPTFAFFSVVILVGLSVGCCARRFIDARTGAPAPPAPETWSERWAQELEYAVEDLYDLFVETPAALLRWLRPHLRQVGRGANRVLDACDTAMEPCYCVLDWVQDHSWNVISAVHERLVGLVAFARNAWQRAFAEEAAAKGRGARRARPREDKSSIVVEGLLDEDPPPLPRDAAAKPRSKGHPPRPPSRPACRQEADGARAEGTKAGAVEHVEEVEVEEEEDEEALGGASTGAANACEVFSWDPLRLTPNPIDAPRHLQALAALAPPEWMRLQEARHATSPSNGVPGVVAAGLGANNAAARGGSPPPAKSSAAQTRMQRKLQQRREALAQRGAAETASPVAPQQEEPAPIDESWIDELEKAAASKRGGRGAKVKDRRRRTDGRKDSGTLVAPSDAQNPERPEEGRGQHVQLANSEADHNEEQEGHEEGGVHAGDQECDDGEEEEEDEGPDDGEGDEDEEEEEEEDETGREAEDVEDEGEEEEEEQQEEEEEEEAVEENAKEDCAADVALAVPSQEGPAADAAGVAPSEATAREVVRWEHEVDGAWRRYDEATEQLISDAEAAGWASLECRVKGQVHVIDLKNLVQTTKKNGSHRSIRRVPPLQAAGDSHLRRHEQAEAGSRSPDAKASAATPAPQQPPKPQPAQSHPRPAPKPAGHGQEPQPRQQPPTRAEPQPKPQPPARLEPQPPQHKPGPESPPLAAARRPGQPPQPQPAQQPQQQPSPKGTSKVAGAEERPRAPRAYAQVVAGISVSDAEASAAEAEAAEAAATSSFARATSGGGRTLAADAPEFVPAAMMAQQQQQMLDARLGRSMPPKKKKSKRSDDEMMQGQMGANDCQFTTVAVSGLARTLTTAGLRKMLDAWGMGGTYDFLYIFEDETAPATLAGAIINFVDPAFVYLFCWQYQQAQMSGTVVPAQVQGLKANEEHWLQYCSVTELRYEVIAEERNTSLGFRPSGLPPQRVFIEAVEPESWAAEVGITTGDELMAVNGLFVSDMGESELLSMRRERPLRLTLRREERTSEPAVIANPMPSQWAVNSVNEMIAPHVREQFRKTKMCTFHTQNRCELGDGCPFAHSPEELMPVPDLAKTKLCYNFFCKRCTDPRCKFAHGSQELRSDWLACAPAMYMWGSCPPTSGIIYTAMGPMGDFGAMADAAMGGYAMSQDGFMQALIPMGEMPLMGAVPILADPTLAHMHMASNGRRTADLLHILHEPDLVGSGMHQGRMPAPPQRRAAVGKKPLVATPPGTPDATDRLVGREARDEQLRRPSAMTLLPTPDKQVMLRECGTFMESMQVREELLESTRHRSWSDSDLPAFKEAMEDAVLG